MFVLKTIVKTSVTKRFHFRNQAAFYVHLYVYSNCVVRLRTITPVIFRVNPLNKPSLLLMELKAELHFALEPVLLV